MYGFNQEVKNNEGQRKQKRRNFQQYCQTSSSSQYNSDIDFCNNDNDCFLQDNQFVVRGKLKPYENEFECEGVQYQPIILDQQLLKEFSILYRLQNMDVQQNQSDYYQKDKKYQSNPLRPSNQIEAHVQYLINQKRIPEEKAKLIQAQLYNYYNQINKF